MENATFSHLNISNGTQFRWPVDSCGRKFDLTFGPNMGSWQWITRISFPILLALGTLGNIYGIVVGWLYNRYSQRVFLLGMCTVSLLYLWNQLIILIGSNLWDLSGGNESVGPAYMEFYIYGGGIFLYMDQLLYLASQWILLMFCLERCVAVAFPIFHYTKKRRLFGGITVTAVFFVSAVVGILVPVLWYYNLALKGTLEKNQLVRALPRQILLWKDIDTWWELIFSIVVYFVVCGCNLLLTRALQQNRRRTTLDLTGFNTKDGSSSSCGSEINVKMLVNPRMTTRCVPNATRTQILFTSSVFYLVTQSLKVTMCILVILSRQPFCGFQVTMSFLGVYDPLTVLLQNTYFAFEFIFLVWLGSADRKKLRSLCCNKA